MQVDLCRHIKANGHQCRAVALKSSVFCYFHRHFQRSHDTYRDEVYLHPQRVASGTCMQLPLLEDHDSIQIAISSVVNALATDIITEKRAYALYQGLYLASANASRRRRVRHPNQLVRDIYKEPWTKIPEASPDIAPPGRTIEIQDPTEPAPETGCPVLTPLGRDAATTAGCPIHDSSIVMSGDAAAPAPPLPTLTASGTPPVFTRSVKNSKKCRSAAALQSTEHLPRHTN